jgi:hypothetical protein
MRGSRSSFVTDAITSDAETKADPVTRAHLRWKMMKPSDGYDRMAWGTTGTLRDFRRPG